jgi:uncharacterized protein YbjT (DUF2867 family)
MFLVAGITGKVGGATARKLLDEGREVRALVRDRTKAAEWSLRVVELREGDLTDASTLAGALQGVEGAFLMQPTPMGVSPGFPEAMALNASIVEALRRSPPPRLVVLSSVGSEQTSGLGNITQTQMLEAALRDVAFPVAFLRAGALIENFLASIDRAAETGVLDSFLQPVDRAFPMVATWDVGAEVARLLTAAPWEGRRVIEMGSRITPDEVAAGMAEALGRSVEAKPIPREYWDATISAMGIPPEKAGNWAEMEDGFNSGWIDFGRPGTEAVAGTTAPARVFAQASQGGPPR